MRFRDNRINDENRRPPAPVGGNPPGGAELSSQRQSGERFLAAADEAISRALSDNSERFLAANRQQGGQ